MGEHRQVELLRVPAAARILGIAEGTLRNWLCGSSKNPIPKYVRIGRSIFFDREDLIQFIIDQKVDSSNQR